MRHIVVRGELKGAHRSEAVEVLKDGGTVLLPCGGNYLLVSLKEAKLQPFGPTGRQRLVRDRRELEALWDAPLPAAVKLADALMPGALTLAVQTSLGRAGVMMPDSSFLAGAAAQLSEPLYFKEVLDCDSGSDLQDAYPERVDLWLDVGGVHLVPSTLVDATRESPRLERKGAIPILDIERVLGTKVRLGPAVVFSVLLVCTGNTCRSAMARGIMEQRLTRRNPRLETLNSKSGSGFRTPGLDLPLRIVISSAGTNTVPGLPASEGARLAAEALGIDLSRHRSTPLNARRIRDADLVLGMESRHKRRVIELVPEAAARTFVLAEFSATAGLRGIRDPMGSSLEVFHEVAKIIAESLEPVAEDIEWRLNSE